MRKLVVPFLILPVLALGGCSSQPHLYSLTAVVSFVTATEDTNPNLPKKNGEVFLCNPSGGVLTAKDVFGQPQMVSIMDENWGGSDLEIYDSSQNLVGVADTAIPQLTPDGNCEVTFKYSNLHLSDSPIRFKTSTGDYWDVPESQWKTGFVQLNGTGTSF